MTDDSSPPEKGPALTPLQSRVVFFGAVFALLFIATSGFELPGPASHAPDPDSQPASKGESPALTERPTQPASRTPETDTAHLKTIRQLEKRISELELKLAQQIAKQSRSSVSPPLPPGVAATQDLPAETMTPEQALQIIQEQKSLQSGTEAQAKEGARDREIQKAAQERASRFESDIRSQIHRLETERQARLEAIIRQNQ